VAAIIPHLRQTRAMHARSALFDLYGDHLLSRGGQAPVASLVRLLEPLGIAAPAVRTAVSRMVRQGWLVPTTLAAGPGYAVTDRARHRLAASGERIYRTREVAWDGAWDVVVVHEVPGRAARQRLRSGLGFLGYALLAESTWVGPHPSSELAEVLEGEGVRWTRFRGPLKSDLATVLDRWDLDGLAAEYRAWCIATQERMAAADRPLADREAFALRSTLLNEWRKFLFSDPGLPAALLPTEWPGHAAYRIFDEHAERLLPAAARFVDSCLGDEPTATSVPDAPLQEDA
jgi:phenylacetic acid degradation operon negative regulatory protein